VSVGRNEMSILYYLYLYFLLLSFFSSYF
jgi:hypothetical protein